MPDRLQGAVELPGALLGAVPPIGRGSRAGSSDGSRAIGEVEAWADARGLGFLLGVDEAGRGPLAGPVVAGAVLLPGDHCLLDLDDSKRLTERCRERLFPLIRERALAHGIGVVDAQTIDRIGILPATFQAMRQAVGQAVARLSASPALVVVDGKQVIPGLALPQRAVVRGDSRSWNVAAASVLAKVTRDRLMVEHDVEWPEYGFARHKGYGTAVHLRALVEHGPCPIHRRSFGGVVPSASSSLPK